MDPYVKKGLRVITYATRYTIFHDGVLWTLDATMNTPSGIFEVYNSAAGRCAFHFVSRAYFRWPALGVHASIGALMVQLQHDMQEDTDTKLHAAKREVWEAMRLD